jgi:hypothetical protein
MSWRVARNLSSVYCVCLSGGNASTPWVPWSVHHLDNLSHLRIQWSAGKVLHGNKRSPIIESEVLCLEIKEDRFAELQFVLRMSLSQYITSNSDA